MFMRVSQFDVSPRVKETSTSSDSSKTADERIARSCGIPWDTCMCNKTRYAYYAEGGYTIREIILL